MAERESLVQKLRVERYEDLTLAEQVGTVEFVRLTLKGALHEAERALQVCLDLEHFLSVIPLDPKAFDDEITDELKELQRQCQEITGRKIPLNALGERRAMTAARSEVEHAALQAQEEKGDDGVPGTTPFDPRHIP